MTKEDQTFSVPFQVFVLGVKFDEVNIESYEYMYLSARDGNMLIFEIEPIKVLYAMDWLYRNLIQHVGIVMTSSSYDLFAELGGFGEKRE